MDIINIVAAIDVWFSAICTVVITLIALVFSSISKKLIYGDIELDTLCYGPDLALTGLSLDIFALSIYPKLFLFPKYQPIDPSKIWIIIILIHLLLYLFVVYCSYKGSSYHYILSGTSRPKVKLLMFTQISNVTGILMILSSLMVIQKAI
jgi:hypothetical protein